MTTYEAVARTVAALESSVHMCTRLAASRETQQEQQRQRQRQECDSVDAALAKARAYEQALLNTLLAPIQLMVSLQVGKGKRLNLC